MYVMLDFETLGTAADTIALSLGAVAFNKEGIVGERLWTFDLDDQVLAKRTFTASTLRWWIRQSDNAKKVFADTEDGIKLADFFVEFESFCDDNLKTVGETRRELKPVGNGANFDVSLLEHIIRESHPKKEYGILWKHWNVWCFRTVDHLFKIKDATPRPHGTHHSALDDARYQAHCFIEFLNRAKKKKAAKVEATEAVSESDF